MGGLGTTPKAPGETGPRSLPVAWPPVSAPPRPAFPAARSGSLSRPRPPFLEWEAGGTAGAYEGDETSDWGPHLAVQIELQRSNVQSRRRRSA